MMWLKERLCVCLPFWICCHNCKKQYFILFPPHKLVLQNNLHEKFLFLWPLDFSTSLLNLFRKSWKITSQGYLQWLLFLKTSWLPDKLVTRSLVILSSIILLERRKWGCWAKQKCKRLLISRLIWCVFIFIQPDYKCNLIHAKFDLPKEYLKEIIQYLNCILLETLMSILILNLTTECPLSW